MLIFQFNGQFSTRYASTNAWLVAKVRQNQKKASVARVAATAGATAAAGIAAATAGATAAGTAPAASVRTVRFNFGYFQSFGCNRTATKQPRIIQSETKSLKVR